jgi:hypothetical protein
LTAVPTALALFSSAMEPEADPSRVFIWALNKIISHQLRRRKVETLTTTMSTRLVQRFRPTTKPRVVRKSIRKSIRTTLTSVRNLSHPSLFAREEIR